MASHQKCYPLKYMMPELELPMEDLKPVQDAIAQGDNLANTPAILEARVSRRALLVVIQHDMDARNLLSAHGASLYLPTTPSDAVRVYLDRGYEKHNIRVQVERVHKNPETSPTKPNIVGSVALSQVTTGFFTVGKNPAPQKVYSILRHAVVSGHGHAYEVEQGQGKATRVITASPGIVGSTGTPIGEQISSVTNHNRIALITEWRYPMLGEEIEELFRSDDHGKISDYVCLYFSPALFPSLRAAQELYAVLAKLLKGCTLTVSDGDVGGMIKYVDQKPSRRCRCHAGNPSYDISDAQVTPSNFAAPISSESSLRNLFVPPAFFLHSGYDYDPKIKMERIDEPELFKDVKAKIAFTSAVQEVEGTVSNAALYENVKCAIIFVHMLFWIIFLIAEFVGNGWWPKVGVMSNCGFLTMGVKQL
ncbi:hypothetical protein AG1IA_09045 [Rhizoctonia solani AG-1 IA]|uniref:Uncharacterized protein n=1 Tax=Thanatephorus cucumeris (strain AG1-IA) TaxID=983506 RepID=L8WG36_THACA|nr:hypothetical protein AG1IA_09045 [Rhizoctonia solani AG-1 IA]